MIREPRRLHALRDRIYLIETFAQYVFSAKHTAVVLQHTQKIVAHLCDRFTLTALIPTRKPCERLLDRGLAHGTVITMLTEKLNDAIARGAAEHHDVEQRNAAATVGAEHRHARALAHRIQARHRLLAAARAGHDLAVAIGRDAAHRVMRGRADRYCLFRRVDVQEGVHHVAYAWQTFVDHLFAKVVDLEQHVIAMRPAAAALAHLGRDRAAHHVAARKVLHIGRVALHEAFAVLVDEITALATRAFGNEHALAGDAGRMELEEHHVFERKTGTQHHAHAIAGVDARVGVGAEQAADAARREQGRLCLDHQRLAGLDLEHHRAEDITLVVLDEVYRIKLVEKMRLRADVLLIERVQDRMARAIRRRAGARGLIAAEVLALATEGALIDLAVVEPRERHACVLELHHQARGRSAHVFDRVLVAEVIAALHRVVHVPVPVVRAHVAERGIHAALRRDRVRARRKDLGYDGHRGLRLGQLQRGAQATAARADHQRVEAPPRHCLLYFHHQAPEITCTTHTPIASSAAASATSTVRRTA